MEKGVAKVHPEFGSRTTFRLLIRIDVQVTHNLTLPEYPASLGQLEHLQIHQIVPQMQYHQDPDINRDGMEMA
jgi:hypothetical protein